MSSRLPALHGVMAEFADATELVAAPPRRRIAEGYRQMDAYSAVPIHGLAEAMGHDDRRVQKFTFIGGVLGLPGWLRALLLDVGHRLPAQHRRSSAQQLGGLLDSDLRDDDSAGGAGDGGRHAGHQRPADALPSGVQRRGLPQARVDDGFFLCIEATDPTVRRARGRGCSSRGCTQGDQRGERVAMTHALNTARAAREPRLPAAAGRAASRSRRAAAGGASAAAAVRTCTTRRATRRSRRATSSPTSAPCARFPRAPSRAAICARTMCSTRARPNGEPVQTLPAQVKVDKALLDRGQERYNIYCSPCHSPLGDGNGMVVQRGFKRPASFHDPRLRNMAHRLLLRRDHQRLRPDAGLRGAGRARRSLGDRRVHPRAAAAASTRRSRTCRPTSVARLDGKAPAAAPAPTEEGPRMTEPRLDPGHFQAPPQIDTLQQRRPGIGVRRPDRPRCRLCRSTTRSSTGRTCWLTCSCSAFRIGSLALLMIHHLSGGRWSLVLRRTFEASARTIPLMALLFIPIVLGMHELYEWSHADVVGQGPASSGTRSRT